MKKNLRILSALGLLTACGVATAADETPVVSTAPSLSSVLASSGITLTGYVDGTYVYSSGFGTGHQFDTQHNSFQLNQAAFTLAYQPKEGFGALVNVVGGSDAGALPPGGGDVVIPQAFVQYASGIVTVSAGRLLTLAGAEVFAPTGNTNVSRSLLFFAEPLTHTGIRAAFAVSDKFGFTLGVNNGWNYTSLSGSPAKTAEIGFSVTPSKIFSISAQGYFGKDALVDAQKKIVDVVATITATDSLSFLASYDFGSQDNPAAATQKWDGVAVYANIGLNEMLRLSVRAEYFDDKDGLLFSGGSEKVKEATVTLGIMPAKSFELRIEARYDKAGNAIFPKADSGNGNPPKDNQTALLLEGLYKF